MVSETVDRQLVPAEGVQRDDILVNTIYGDDDQSDLAARAFHKLHRACSYVSLNSGNTLSKIAPLS